MASSSDWLHVEDNSCAILSVLEKGSLGEVYNIGGSQVEENLDMARRVLNLTGRPESLSPGRTSKLRRGC